MLEEPELPAWRQAWFEDVKAAQRVTHYEIEGCSLPRIAYGQEDADWGAAAGRTCHDCGVSPGQFHLPGCDVERCPACKGQLITCKCVYDDDQDQTSADRFACPCCRCLTIDRRGSFEICPVCFWEDDGQDDNDAATVRGGPDGFLSLSEARANYRRFGACEERLIADVRRPYRNELPK